MSTVFKQQPAEERQQELLPYNSHEEAITETTSVEQNATEVGGATLHGIEKPSVFLMYIL